MFKDVGKINCQKNSFFRREKQAFVLRKYLDGIPRRSVEHLSSVFNSQSQVVALRNMNDIFDTCLIQPVLTSCSVNNHANHEFVQRQICLGNEKKKARLGKRSAQIEKFIRICNDAS